jgi:hypothetical protein
VAKPCFKAKLCGEALFQSEALAKLCGEAFVPKRSFDE